MTTDKKPASAQPQPAVHSALYDQAVQDYGSALDLLRKGDLPAAQALFQQIDSRCHVEEPTLAERARTYAIICGNKLAPAAEDPRTPEDSYNRAVLWINAREPDKAIRYLDQALHAEPTSAKLLYARASAWALKGNLEAAVRDLRQSIGIEPQIRFQAINDSDFAKIREEPAFIDVIEPTPSGA